MRYFNTSHPVLAWISSDYFESFITLSVTSLLRGESDSKQSDEFQDNPVF